MMSNGFARNALGPAELRLASEAFEAALAEVSDSDLHPYMIRKGLAQHVMRSILAGERDTTRLRDGALASLRSLGSGETVQDHSGPPNSSNENVHPLHFAKA